MDLSGVWHAIEADDDLRRTWLDTGTDDLDDWAHVAVPGHWRTTDAFADTDGPLLYRTDFDHPIPGTDERIWLRFDGVFYQGDVWLDGGYVGDTEGYFFPHTFEVTDALRDRGSHTLGVEVTCSAPGDRTKKRNITGAFQHHPSIDPDWNPGGIWRPVRLERTGPIRIRHLRVRCAEATETRATVRFRAVLDAAEAGDVLLRSTVGDTELLDERRLAAGENQVEWQLRIDDPELWWPHALGSQPLHEVVVEVTPLGDRGGLVSDGDAPADPAEVTVDRPVSHRVTRRIGLRQVDLRGWVLSVNGERLFLKGVNLGPTALDLAQVDPADLARDVDLAKDAGLDLIRLQSHITRPELYDAADEAGMLVWQDFPLQWGYARSIRKQAQRQAREAVDLLGHHPSVAIWCGHNEPLGIDGDPGDEGEALALTARFLAGQQLPSWNRSILDRTVKRALDQADGTRPVIPHSGVLPHPPQFDGTDSHLSFGWYHGDARELDGLARTVPRLVRFVSEFGAQSIPSSDEFLEPERWPDLDWDHLERAHGYQRGVLERHVPHLDHPTLDAWRAATQAYQALVVRRQVETLRRLKYRPTGGFAVLALADAQPAISWSVLDHERVPKAAYAALRDACRPVIAVADHLPDELLADEALDLEVHVISDRRTDLTDVQVEATLSWEGGEQRWRFAGDVGADSCVRVGALRLTVPDRPGPVTLSLALSHPDAAPDGGPVVRVDTSRIVAR